MNTALKATAALALTMAIACPGYAACSPGLVGTSHDCPIYTQSGDAVPQNPAMGQSTTTTGTGRIVLFGGQVPQHGYMVSLSSFNYTGSYCWVDDNDLANINQGFLIVAPGGVVNVPNTFTTPSGYEPPAPVTMICNSPVSFVARSW